MQVAVSNIISCKLFRLNQIQKWLIPDLPFRLIYMLHEVGTGHSFFFILCRFMDKEWAQSNGRRSLPMSSKQKVRILQRNVLKIDQELYTRRTNIYVIYMQNMLSNKICLYSNFQNFIVFYKVTNSNSVFTSAIVGNFASIFFSFFDSSNCTSQC